MGKSIYDIHYPQCEKLSVSYGILKGIEENEYNFSHLCNTETGSSGSPIIDLSNNNIIGIHIGGYEHFSFNKGAFLNYPILEFINNINQKE